MTLAFDERVEVSFGKDGFSTRKFEDYSVRCAVTEQPSNFSVRFGQAESVVKIFKSIPMGSPFRLSIAGLRQFTGEVSGFDFDRGPSGTRLTYMGRDSMAAFEADVDAERSFPNTSIKKLVEEAIKAVGLTGRKVLLSNATNLKARSGAPFKVPIIETKNKPTGFKAVAKFGESWMSFLHRQLSKVGLFLFTDCNGDFVIAIPNSSTRALFLIHNIRGQLREVSNATSVRVRHDTSRRLSECIVYARNLGRKAGKNHTHGDFVDAEMKKLGIERPKVYRDPRVTTPEQAQFFARRQIAAANRAALSFEYTLAGHSAPLIGGGHTLITPDVVVRVVDEDLDINEDMYLDAVEYRSPPKTTVVRLMRLKDMVFGSDE